MQLREKLLISGDAGSGKTLAMVGIAVKVLSTTPRKTFWIDCDEGLGRFREPFLADWDDELGGDGRFVYYKTEDWEAFYRAYKDIKTKWSAWDWVFVDRVDMEWTQVQNYYDTGRRLATEAELAQQYLDARISQRGQETSEEKRSKDKPPESIPVGTDWQLINGAYYSVVYDLYGPGNASRKNINVVMSALAMPRDRFYSPKDDSKERKRDPRDFPRFGMRLEGQKDLPGQCEGHLYLQWESAGYTVSTVKDRQRSLMDSVPINLVDPLGDPISGGLVEAYERVVGVKLGV